MPIKKLDHVNVRTTRLAEMVKWYEEVLGLTNGPRPNFPFAGAWLYAGDTAAVHLVEVDTDAVGSETELKLEHFAFRAEDAESFEANLKAHGATFERVDIASIKSALYNVHDPDGNHIHVDFFVD